MVAAATDEERREGFREHEVLDEDTVQKLALQYAVTVRRVALYALPPTAARLRLAGSRAQTGRAGNQARDPALCANAGHVNRWQRSRQLTG